MPEKKLKKTNILTFKFGITAGAAVLFSLVVLYLVFAWSLHTLIVMPEYDNITDKSRLAANLIRASTGSYDEFLQSLPELEAISGLTLDGKGSLPDKELIRSAFKRFGFNMFFVRDQGGKIIYEQSYDHLKDMFTQRPSGLMIALRDISELVESSSREDGSLCVSGFGAVRGDVYYFISCEIDFPDGTGVVTFVRTIDKGVLDALTPGARDKYEATTIEQMKYVLYENDLKKLQSEGSLIVTRYNEVVSYVTMEDIFGKESIVVSCSSPRTLYTQISVYMCVSLAASAVCIIAVLLFAMWLKGWQIKSPQNIPRH